VAVDEKDGHEVWLTTVGNTDLGETFAAAPLIAKDKVIVGNSGGELGVRGYVVALSLSDGKTA
jgi:alcohol dehydrogenase (cytochrome c)